MTSQGTAAASRAEAPDRPDAGVRRLVQVREACDLLIQ